MSTEHAPCPGEVSSSSSQSVALQSELCWHPEGREAHPGVLAPGQSSRCLPGDLHSGTVILESFRAFRQQASLTGKCVSDSEPAVSQESSSGSDWGGADHLKF